MLEHFSQRIKWHFGIYQVEKKKKKKKNRTEKQKFYIVLPRSSGLYVGCNFSGSTLCCPLFSQMGICLGAQIKKEINRRLEWKLDQSQV